MRSFILTIITLSLLTACSSEQPTSSETQSGESSDLDKRIAQLERESAQKDSLINESLEFFSEIQTNLESIEIKKDELRIISTNPEITSDDKKWILDQIRHINYLREENARKVLQLNKKLKESGLKIKELNNMIDDLLLNIQARDEQIGLLQNELGSLDKAYSKLFDAYQEKAELVAELTDELNTVYYSYGTEEELAKNQVIELKNGFIGIGKKIKLMDDFNEKYFAKIDLTEEKEIFVEGSDLKFITDHPSKSYSLVRIGKNTKIKISNPREFWKVSKYLVVIVD
jgi:predicted RNA-binding protein with EMAP domain